MKTLLEKACVWFLTRKRKYTVYPNQPIYHNVPAFMQGEHNGRKSEHD
ncbi:hypothetical protein [Muribacter muris]|nr:hypothetical protein [Muribacter muris]